MANISLSLREARRFNKNGEEIYPLIYQTLQNALWKSTGLIFVADFTCADQGKKKKRNLDNPWRFGPVPAKKISYKQVHSALKLPLNCFSVCTRLITLWISVASNVYIYVIMKHHFRTYFLPHSVRLLKQAKLQFCHQISKLSCIILFFINRKISWSLRFGFLSISKISHSATKCRLIFMTTQLICSLLKLFYSIELICRNLISRISVSLCVFGCPWGYFVSDYEVGTTLYKCI